MLDLPEAENIVQRLIVEANNELQLLKLPKSFKVHIKKMSENVKTEFAEKIHLQALNQKLSLAHQKKVARANKLTDNQMKNLGFRRQDLELDMSEAELNSVRRKAEKLQ